jgi:two-component system NtrC family sensor kinase
MSAGDIRGKRILVVEDEPVIADLLTDMLMDDGHEVDAVHTGRAALERLVDHAYDLIVSDLRMPVLDGRGLYRELELRHPAMLRRILFVTGSALDPGNVEFLAATRVPWLAKPFTITELHRMTQKVLAGS